jgi:hypothetical protein
MNPGQPARSRDDRYNPGVSSYKAARVRTNGDTAAHKIDSRASGRLGGVAPAESVRGGDFGRVFRVVGGSRRLAAERGRGGLVHLGHVRTPLWRLSEVGPIDIVLAGCRYSGSISPRWTRRVYQIAGGALLIGFCVYAYATLDEAEPRTRAAANWQISRHFLELLGYVAVKWVGFKNSTWRLLIGGEGLFRLTDPTRPWVTKSDVREPNSRLRATRIYAWDQIERFHISDRDNGSTLHLNVRFPNTPFAQRMSYDLPSLSESEREQLEAALLQHIPAATGTREPAAV